MPGESERAWIAPIGSGILLRRKAKQKIKRKAGGFVESRTITLLLINKLWLLATFCYIC